MRIVLIAAICAIGLTAHAVPQKNKSAKPSKSARAASKQTDARKKAEAEALAAAKHATDDRSAQVAGPAKAAVKTPASKGARGTIQLGSSSKGKGGGTRLRFSGTSGTVNGLRIEKFSCQLTKAPGGFLGMMVLMGELAKHKRALKRCGKQRVPVSWTLDGRRYRQIKAKGRVGRCVAKALRRTRTTARGRCSAELVLGRR